MSKRDRDLDLGILRQKMKPEQLIGILACSAGLTEKPEAVSAKELAHHFVWSRVRKESVCLNETLSNFM